MISRRRALVLAVLLLALGSFLARPATHSSPAVQRVVAALRPTAWVARDDECAALAAELRAETEWLRRELEGAPVPFSPEVPAEQQPDHVLAEVEELRRAGAQVDAVDCSEYPCLIAIRTQASFDAPAVDDARYYLQWRVARGRQPWVEAADGRVARWQVAVRADPNETFPEVTAEATDPELARRVQVRAAAALAKAAEGAGARVVTEREAMERRVAMYAEHPDRFEGILNTPESFENRLDRLVQRDEELAARPPPPPDPCGPAVDEARAARDAAERALRTPAGAPSDPAFLPAAIEAEIQESLAACPEFAGRFLGYDCEEYPCVLVYRVPDGENAFPYVPAACAPWAKVDVTVPGEFAHLLDEDGEDALLRAVAYAPADEYLHGDPRTAARIQDALLDARYAHDLTVRSRREQIEQRIGWLRENLSTYEPIERDLRQQELSRLEQDPVLRE